MIYADGAVYEGFWKDGVRQGRGRLVHTTGDVYEGEWNEDAAHGYGSFTNTEGYSYSGTWVEDQQEGEGIETWSANNSRYVGQFSKSKKNGTGRFEWADGSYYEGDFL